MTAAQAIAQTATVAAALEIPFTPPPEGAPIRAYLDIQGALYYNCPACEESHRLPITPQEKPGPVWGWNGRIDEPTLTPSILCTWYTPEPQVCHHFLTAGRVECLHDSAKGGGTNHYAPAFPAT